MTSGGDYQRSLRHLLRLDASAWAYKAGMPRYQAEAFAEWYVDKYIDPRFRPTFSEAKSAWNLDPEALAILAKHGRQPVTVCRRCNAELFQDEAGTWLSNGARSPHCDTDEPHQPRQLGQR